MNRAKKKPWYQSKGVIGGIVAALSPIVAVLFGVDFGAEEQAALTDLIIQGIGVGGGLVAIYGRVKAEHRIG